ncbi:MAG: hypothetical protein ACM31C_33630 [Acidobacteriota bacterium]
MSDPQVASVVLYIGNDGCSVPNGSDSSVPCAALTPDTESQPLRVGQNGGAFFRDTNVNFESKVTAGKAEFHLESTGGAQTVEIIAVGYTKDPATKTAAMVKVLDGVQIPATNSVRIQTTLDPASPVVKNEDPRTAQPDGSYVLVWASPNAPGECVLAEQWSSGKARRTYVVPSEDADCDGLPTMDGSGNRNPLECDPLWYIRPTPIGSGKSDCGALGPFTTNNTTTADVCMIGGPACLDGVGLTSAACAPLANIAYCMPHDVCLTHCAMPPPTGGPLSSCLDATATATMPHVECTIYASDTGDPCGTNNTVTIDGTALFAGSQKTCQGLQWAPDSLIDYTPMDTLAFPGVPAQFQTSVAGDPCSIQIEWNGGSLNPLAQEAWVLADLKVTDTQHLVIPVRFLRMGCPPPGTDTITCTATWDGAGVVDSMLSCAK